MRLLAHDVFDIDIPNHLRGYELVDGRLVEVSHVTLRHARIVAKITYRLMAYLDAHELPGNVYPEAGYVLRLARDPERLRSPDVSFMTEATLRRGGGERERGWSHIVPDLVVEVDSPNRQPSIERARIRDYLEVGVRLIWVIHTETGSASVYRADGSVRDVRVDDALDGEDLLPGFRLPLADLLSTIAL
jgi:Uma2 family endonuclease